MTNMNDELTQDELDSLSGSDRSTAQSTFGGTPTNGSKEELVIAKEENSAVLKIRMTIAVFLLLCTLGTAVLVYHSTKGQEHEEFEEEFYDYSSRVFGSLATTFYQAFAAADTYAVSMMTFSYSANLTWPFVTIPKGGTGMVKLIDVVRASGVTFLPYVSADNLDAWNNYSMSTAHNWIQEHLATQEAYTGHAVANTSDFLDGPVHDGGGSQSSGRDHYFPVWQSYPIVPTESIPLYNFDYSSDRAGLYFPGSGEQVIDVLTAGYTELSDIVNAHEGSYVDEYSDTFRSTEPVSELHYPIFDHAADTVLIQDTAGNQSQMVGFLLLSFYWRDQMVDLLPSGVDGLVFVVSTSTDNSFTYQLNGPDVVFLGFGDHHDKDYDDFVLESGIRGLFQYNSGAIKYTGVHLSEELCEYTFRLYPSASFESQYKSANPWIYTAVTVTIFIFTSLVFFVYDMLVERRQKTVMSTAIKSSAIVSSLFPKNVRTRLLDMSDDRGVQPKHSTQKSKLKSFIAEISGGTDVEESTGKLDGIILDSRPIADLFPEATVMFADIVSFTAWSSTREPSQVFILLESVYGSFDKLAAKRGVFKVETIGDCYVAVAGLPDPRRDHAAVMAKFAQDCHNHMRKLVSKLSVTLGPETEEMTMRFGLNSGPVTAGVLRGQKSRFQLFGDTVNTASRMESTGKKDCIHASPSTAEALRQLGKGHWLKLRSDVVEIKGKGKMATFWVHPYDKMGSSDGHEENSQTSHPEKIDGKHENLVKWNVDVLSKLLGAVLARRKVSHEKRTKKYEMQYVNLSLDGVIPIDEVQEIIKLPDYDSKMEGASEDRDEVPPNVMTQLHGFVADIAVTYRDENPFHNFAHASHVCMSVAKLMSRIIAAESFMDEKCGMVSHKSKHEHTFGIVSDPLTLFACAFAALIHDADHPGVPNMQLVKEGTDLARKYKDRSVAEQRSVDLAWELLMEERYTELRDAICGTQEELVRFRELVVNSVMATDIMDKELIGLRNQRWNKAFDANNGDSPVDNMNRKATIVIEHLIQASDVAHTMQHWQVYRAWNQRLFAELYRAYKNGRSEKNPVDNWYKGELGFFDFYIIPLAKKLSDCGVFGVSSDEYLNYAIKNREEWEMKGESIVAEMYQEAQEQFGL